MLKCNLQSIYISLERSWLQDPSRHSWIPFWNEWRSKNIYFCIFHFITWALLLRFSNASFHSEHVVCLSTCLAQCIKWWSAIDDRRIDWHFANLHFVGFGSNRNYNYSFSMMRRIATKNLKIPTTFSVEPQRMPCVCVCEEIKTEKWIQLEVRTLEFNYLLWDCAEREICNSIVEQSAIRNSCFSVGSSRVCTKITENPFETENGMELFSFCWNITKTNQKFRVELADRACVAVISQYSVAHKRQTPLPQRNEMNLYGKTERKRNKKNVLMATCACTSNVE